MEISIAFVVLAIITPAMMQPLYEEPNSWLYTWEHHPEQILTVSTTPVPSFKERSQFNAKFSLSSYGRLAGAILVLIFVIWITTTVFCTCIKELYKCCKKMEDLAKLKREMQNQTKTKEGETKRVNSRYEVLIAVD